jgi:hypothetical protein
MKNLIPLLIIPFASPAMANSMMIQVNVNRVCAAIVEIPYASDNFTDNEWQQFKDCVEYLRQFDDIE